jgi:hypothetical protein
MWICGISGNPSWDSLKTSFQVSVLFLKYPTIKESICKREDESTEAL